MKVVFLYAGQGSQKPGMGKNFRGEENGYTRILDSLPEAAKWEQMMYEGDMDTLTRTDHTQPCMAVYAIGVTELLKERGIKPDAACGLSLGEYGALYAADVLTPEQYLYVLEYRGRIMEEAGRDSDTCMSAVIGMSAEQVKEICETSRSKGYVTVSNFNCPGQYVICGEKEAVSAVENEIKECGSGKCIRLKTGGPFHTKYMQRAGTALRGKIEKMQLQKPAIPVVMNATGDYYDGQTPMAVLLEKQIQSPVLLEDSLVRLLEDGASFFVEIGPGNTMSGFVKKTAKKLKKNVTVMTADSIESMDMIQKIIEENKDE